MPALRFSDGTLEALKWLALVLMVGDHANKYLLAGSVPTLFYAGRIVMPVFAIVLAYNLARPGTLERGVYPRVMRRLAIVGLLASLPSMALGGLGWGWWPLNIMFTLTVAAGCMGLIEDGQRAAAVVLFLLGGLVVEFWWPALAVALGAWLYFRRPSRPALLLCAAGFAGLCLINRNGWALAAVPLLLVARRVDLQMPRLHWIFYAFYPLHLAVLWLVRSTALT